MARLKIGINGFGRIGRSVLRIIEERDDMEVVAVNDLFDNGALRYLLSYDTVMGPFQHDLALKGDELVTPKSRVRMLSQRDPAAIPWAELGVDAVVEATGAFRRRDVPAAVPQARTAAGTSRRRCATGCTDRSGQG